MEYYIFKGDFPVMFMFISNFFDSVENGKIRIIYSEITNDELADAPERVRNSRILNLIFNQFIEGEKEAVC